MSIHRTIEAAKLLIQTPANNTFGFNVRYLQACLETLESSAYKEEIQEFIEHRWKERAKMQDFGKPSSAKYKRAELEFFCGAMTAIHALFPNNGEDRLSSLVPVTWVINPMSGRNIVEVA